LSLATRIICDKKASGAEKHIKDSASFADLDEATLTKAESQARDGKAQKTKAIKESAKAITLESAIDGFSTWLKAQDLKTLKTTEPQKLDALISKLIQVSKNSKAEVKVNA
jgi:molecular chaperone DnaK (HSP70)